MFCFFCFKFFNILSSPRAMKLISSSKEIEGSINIIHVVINSRDNVIGYLYLLVPGFKLKTTWVSSLCPSVYILVSTI